MRRGNFPWIVYQAGHATAIGRDPEASLPVFGNGVDDDVSQPVAYPVVCETIAVEARKPFPRAEPEVALAILVNRPDMAVGKPVRNIVVARRKSLGADREGREQKQCGQQTLRRYREDSHEKAPIPLLGAFTGRGRIHRVPPWAEMTYPVWQPNTARRGLPGHRSQPGENIFGGRGRFW